MTTRERILTLADDGHDLQVIAALLNLDATDVALTLAQSAHIPGVTRLGPFTVGRKPGATVAVDLGAAGRYADYAITLTAAHYDAATGFNVDFETSRTGWPVAVGDVTTEIGTAPGGFAEADALPRTLHGNSVFAQFIRCVYEWAGGEEGEGGAESSATFYADLTSP